MSPIILLGRLDKVYYDHFLLFVKSVILSTDYSITKADEAELQKMLNQFVVDYESLYYKGQEDRIQACKPTFHALLHVAECVEYLGTLPDPK